MAVDEFVWVFIAGALALVIAVVIGLTQFQPAPGEIIQITEFSVGEIGFTTETPVRTEDLGSFSVGERQTLTLQRLPKTEIATSYISAKKETLSVNIPSAYEDTLDRVTIKLPVQDTNLYGNLVILWNGKKASDERFGKGLHEVEIRKELVKGLNTLEIRAENPGYRFWAATAYLLQEVSIDLEYGPNRIIPVELSPRDLQSLNRGSISFFANAPDGRVMTILLNGIKIYEKAPPQQDAAEFTLLNAPIVSGVNVVTFSSPSGPVQIANAKLEIFLSTNELTRARTFNISQENLDMLQLSQRGVIKLAVDEVRRSGSLNIDLNGQKLQLATVVQGENKVQFDPAAVKLGENQVTFSGTGDFIVSNAVIGIGG